MPFYFTFFPWQLDKKSQRKRKGSSMNERGPKMILKTWYSPENLESWFQIHFIKLHACIFKGVITVKTKKPHEYDHKNLLLGANSLWGSSQLKAQC